ncbi:MAG: SdrD B-like domain-containing protein, partial [Bacteroidota bacterium]|nr:SdrD B-like domain-containing protein [Bacteroidota bacterium]
MRLKIFYLFLTCISLCIYGKVNAQNTCDLTGFVTYTQGGWGSPGNSTPGKIRDQYFSGVFPSGLKIGTSLTLTLSTAKAVEDFLPQGGTPGIFSQNYVDPLTTTAGVFAGQLVALSMNINFDNAGKLGTNTLKLENLVIASGTFAGLTVKQFLDLANKAISGEATGYSIDQINTAAANINLNFDNGTTNNGYLTCSIKASLGDRVWFDSNKDGIQSDGELGIAGVTVELHDSNGNVIKTTVTDQNGLYLFDDLQAGKYYVHFIPPADYIITSINQGTDDSKDSDIGQDGNTDWITLASGENNMTIDAGLYKTESCTDLAIEKTVSKTNPQCNEVFTYTIKV